MIKLPLDDNDPRHGMGDRDPGASPAYARPVGTRLSDLGDIDSHVGSGRVPMDEWPFGRPRTSLDPVLTRNVEDTARVGPEQAERRRILRDQLIVALIGGNAKGFDPALSTDYVIETAEHVAARVYPRRP